LATTAKDPFGSLHKPGRAAPVTGIYRVVHDPPHRASHTVLILESQKLPRCTDEHCTVAFLLVQAAPLVDDDPDLQE
jgi:hypothetical protein